MAIYYAYIQPSQIVTVILQNVVFNPNWDLQEIKAKSNIKIMNTNCPIYLIKSQNNFLKFFCHNSTPATNLSTFYTSVPSVYLRDQATLSLLNITIVPDIKTPS